MEMVLKALRKVLIPCLLVKTVHVLFVKINEEILLNISPMRKKYDAQDVTLSIDEKLQSMVYREIKKGGV